MKAFMMKLVTVLMTKKKKKKEMWEDKRVHLKRQKTKENKTAEQEIIRQQKTEMNHTFPGQTSTEIMIQVEWICNRNREKKATEFNNEKYF